MLDSNLIDTVVASLGALAIATPASKKRRSMQKKTQETQIHSDQILNK